MDFKTIRFIFCGLSFLSLVGCSNSDHSKKEHHRKIVQNDHCPALSALHVNKHGYMTARGGWRSKTKGHDYVLPPGFQPKVSGWKYMRVVGFIQADAYEKDLDSNTFILQGCVYRMALLHTGSGLTVPLYLMPNKKHIVDPENRAWGLTGEFSAVCESPNDTKGIQPERCSFSS